MSAVEETGSAQCSGGDWRQSTQCVLRQSCASPSSLPPPARPLCVSIILSTVYGDELQMNQLHLSLSPPLPSCISALHMSPEQHRPPRASTLQ